MPHVNSQPLPRLKNGQFLSRNCPECGGQLQREGRDWICDGLVDPENSIQPLAACTYGVVNGAAA